MRRHQVRNGALAMAGDWFATRIDLWECPQIVRLHADIFPQNVHDMSERCRIVGAVWRTWQLVEQYADDGLLAGYTPAALDAATGLDGWSEHMAAVGWLDILPEGLGIPDFEEWFSQSAKRRLKDARRKKAGRSSAKRPQNVRTVADKTRTECGPENRTEQNRTEEETPYSPPQGDESGFDLDRATEQLRAVYPPAGWVAEKNIRRAIGQAVAHEAWPVILDAAREFSQSRLAKSDYCPQAAAWLRGHRWTDDRAAWNRGEPTAAELEAKAQADKAYRLKKTEDLLAPIRAYKQQREKRKANE